MKIKGSKIHILVVFLLWLAQGPYFPVYAESKAEGPKGEVLENVKIYWTAMINLDYEKAYALTDCGDFSFWLSANGSGVGVKDEDRGWFIVRYKIVGVKMSEANQAVVVVNFFRAGPNTEGKYFTRAEVWRKRGKGWVRKCDVGAF